VCHSSGICPWSSDAWKTRARGGTKVCTITWICGASGNGDSPKSGSGEESSLMKTDENWSFRFYAFVAG